MSAVDDELRRDISARRRATRPRAQGPGPGRAAPKHDEEQRRSATRRARAGRTPRWMVGRCVSRRRKREQKRGPDRGAGPRSARGERAVRVAMALAERQDSDAGGTDGLDKRERGEAECRDVHEPAGRLGGKAEQPAATPEERRATKWTRPARREPRHRGGGVVLARVRPVDEDRRDQSEGEADPRLQRRVPPDPPAFRPRRAYGILRG